MSRAIVAEAPQHVEHELHCGPAATHPGRGLTAWIVELDVDAALGSPKLMEEQNFAMPGVLQDSIDLWDDSGGSLCCVAWRGRVRGVFLFQERLRDGVDHAMSQLRSRGLSLHVLSGDRQSAAEIITTLLPVDAVGELSPDEKWEWVRKRRGNTSAACAMVGDGVNDSLALVAAGRRRGDGMRSGRGSRRGGCVLVA